MALLHKVGFEHGHEVGIAIVDVATDLTEGQPTRGAIALQRGFREAQEAHRFPVREPLLGPEATGWTWERTFAVAASTLALTMR